MAARYATGVSELAEIVATVAAALFAGAAIYVSLVEHPARERSSVEVALAEFGPSYRRAAIMQGSLALVGGIAGITRWAMLGGTGWLAGGALLAALIPYTLLFMLPTTKRLLDPLLAARRDEAVALLCRWGRLHSVRALAGGIALGILLASR
jgi:anthrone oxygenase-like protein